jgi:hypothetical protein
MVTTGKGSRVVMRNQVCVLEVQVLCGRPVYRGRRGFTVMVFILLLSHVVGFYRGQWPAMALAISPSPDVLHAFRAPRPYVFRLRQYRSCFSVQAKHPDEKAKA